jgi:hypothetical protein
MPANYKYLLIVFLLLAGPVHKAFGQNLNNISKQPPVSLDGSVQLTGIFYNAQGIADRRAPFSYIFSGNPTLSIYGLVIPFNFVYSEQDKTVQQPFNQFGISPQYKWVTLHLGYRSITFSPYTLAGYTMLGAGIELNPGKFHAGFMYGRLNKGTKLDTTTQSLVPYSFTRTAYAAKLGYGTQNSFLEVSMLKGKDDASSGPKKIDSLTELVLPEANTVVGVSGKVTFFKKLFIEGNFGASIYTRDINSPIHADSTNSLVKLAEKIAIINGTTEYFTAYDGDIGYKAKTFQFKFQYVRIEPDFQSFGAYFFDNDLERYAFAPNVSLFKNHIRFNGSIGFQHDNLNNQKEATSRKVTSNATLSTDITKKFGIDVTYTNFSNNQQPKTILFADSLKIAETTQNFSITPHLYFINKTTSNTIVAGTTMMQLTDFNTSYMQGTTGGQNIDSKQYFIIYTYGYIPASFNAFINLNTLRLNAGSTTDNNTGFTVGVSKALLKSALRLSLSGGLSRDVRNDGQANVVTSSGNFTYTFCKKNTLGLLFYYTNNEPKNVTALYPAFTEKRVEASYSFNFK